MPAFTRHAMPLGSRLRIGMLLAVILPLLAMMLLGIWHYQRDQENLRHFSGEEGLRSARVAASVLEFLAANTETTLHEVARAVEGGTPPQLILREKLRSQPQIASLAITDGQGRIVASTLAELGHNVADQPHFQAVKAGKPLVYTGVYWAPTLHERAVGVGVPYRLKGRFAGMVLARWSTATINRLLQGELDKSSKGGTTYVTDGQGTLISYPVQALVAQGRNVAANPPVRAALAHRDGWLEFTSLLMGGRRIAGHIWLPHLGWAVISSKPTPATIVEPAERLRDQVLMILISGLLVLFGARLWGRSLTEPLEKLATSMSKARDQGLFAKPTPLLDLAEVPQDVSEYRMLASAYNDLIAELNGCFEEIVAQNEQLQSQQEELQAQNEELYMQQEELQAQQETLQEQNREIQQRSETIRREARLKHVLLSAAGEGVIGLSNEGRVNFVNDAAAALLGAPPDELLARDLAEFIVEPAEACQVHEALRACTVRSVTAEAWKGKLGTFPAEYTLTPLECGEGGVLMLRDATQRLDAERAAGLEAERRLAVAHAEELSERNAELARLSLEAQEASKLKSEFLANISHELRTPLNSIIGYTDLVLADRKTPVGDRHQKDLAVVLRNARHLLSLIDDVLDLSKIEVGRTPLFNAPVAPREILESVELMAAPMAAGKGLRLTVSCDSGLGAVLTDELKVRQILLNLVSNAIKFTHEGSVCVTALARGADRWAIEVRDTGIGIASEHQELIFEAFRQVDASSTRTAGGTGLGLAIARKLARLLGGELTVTSALGRGSAFVLELPREGLPLLPPAQPSPCEYGAESAAPLALVAIDDDPEARTIITDMLKDTRYSVVPAASADEGVRLVRRVKPCAVILDVLMTGKSGWSVLQELKADPACGGVPVVVLSTIEDRPLAFALGAAAYLSKPADRAALTAALDAVVAPQEPEEETL